MNPYGGVRGRGHESMATLSPDCEIFQLRHQALVGMLKQGGSSLDKVCKPRRRLVALIAQLFWSQKGSISSIQIPFFKFSPKKTQFFSFSLMKTLNFFQSNPKFSACRRAEGTEKFGFAVFLQTEPVVEASDLPPPPVGQILVPQL